jgi:hypothetical protein
VLDNQSSIPGKEKIFLFFMEFKTGLRPTWPPMPWVPGIKRSELEADHLPSARFEVMNVGAVPLLDSLRDNSLYVSQATRITSKPFTYPSVHHGRYFPSENYESSVYIK